MNKSSKPSFKWRRVLLKVSGEALAGDHSQNIDPKITMDIAREVAAVTRLGIEVTTMDSFILILFWFLFIFMIMATCMPSLESFVVFCLVGWSWTGAIQDYNKQLL
ncbi:hypothetical protein JHK86_043215 [Glycine max]|nr:hypothetical protein JHK86_043215 [Glycine max]